MGDNGSDFDAFYAATAQRMVGQVYAFCADLAEAEDAVAEAYARAWQRWPAVSTYGDPFGWVRRVAIRLSVSSWRRTRARLGAHRRHGVGEPTPGLTPDRVALITALQKLPADQRHVIVLHYVADAGVEDIAREIGIPVNTVKSRLHRGRAALARSLEDPEEVATSAWPR